MPFAQEHLQDIKRGEHAAGHPDDLAKLLNVGGSGMAVLYGRLQRPEATDHPLACAGVVPSEDDRARGWLILSEGLPAETMDGVQAALRSFFSRQCVQRIEMPVPQTARTLTLLARKIGFTLAACGVKDSGNGTPYALFVYEPELPRILESADAEIAKATAEGDRGRAVRIASAKGQLLKAAARMRRCPW